MDKNQFLENLRGLIQTGQLSKEEVLNAIGAKPAVAAVSGESVRGRRARHIVNILYGIGGLVIFVGVVALIAQSWGTLPSFARIIATLGMSLVLYVSGILIFTQQKFNLLAQILSAVALALFPVGLAVAFYESGINIEGVGMIVTILGISTALPAISAFLIRKAPVFTVFAVLFATALAYSILAYLEIYDPEPYLYLTIALGVAHFIIGYYWKAVEPRLVNLFYGTGTIGVLTGAIALGGVWDALFAVVVVGVLVLSVYLKSRIILILGALYFIGYLFKITSQYFANSIGWPVALIILGILTIAIAVGTFKVSKKYF